MKGCVQVYTGDGKGKTTAALGLALRAAGAGLKVYFGQFLKDGTSSEIQVIRRVLPEVTVEHFGRPRFVRRNPSARDISDAAAGLQKLRTALLSRNYDVVVADEINVATDKGLLSVSDVLDLLSDRPAGVEFILTGRSADPRICKQADLITEMCKVKHYYDGGTTARKGIET